MMELRSNFVIFFAHLSSILILFKLKNIINTLLRPSFDDKNTNTTEKIVLGVIFYVCLQKRKNISTVALRLLRV